MSIPALKDTFLDGYEILSVLGSGSFGVVYLARDPAGELLAIKEFRGGPELAQKFFRELSVVFSVRHPNIVECRNLLYGGGPRNYLVFEYINGGSLREALVERECFPAAEALAALRDICLGLDHAHRNQIVHRDLKPENILIAADGSARTYKIADLGIARFQGDNAMERSSCGSPAYMAPEQYYGEYSEASDLYSMGVMLYEMLAGHRPFEGPFARLFMMHLHETPDLSRIHDAGCRDLVGRLLSKRVEDRLESASALLEAIESLIERMSGRAEVNVAAVESRPAAAGAWEAPLYDSMFAQERHSVEMAGAERVISLHSRRSPRLVLASCGKTDCYDLSRGRLTPQYLAEPVQDVVPSTVDPDAAYLASRGRLWIYDARNHTTRTLRPDLAGAKRLAVDVERRLVFLAARGMIICLDWQGAERWRFQCPNYAMPPQLSLLSDGTIACSSGPIKPFVATLSPTGELIEKYPVSSPVAGLFANRDPGGFSAILTGLGGSSPVQWLRFKPGGPVAEIPLGSKVCVARMEAGLVSVVETQGVARLLTDEGRELSKYHSNGAILDVCWNQCTLSWCILENSCGVTSMQIIQMRPEFSPGNPDFFAPKSLHRNACCP